MKEVDNWHKIAVATAMRMVGVCMYILKLTISTKASETQAVAVDKTMELDGLLAVFGINANNSE